MSEPATTLAARSETGRLVWLDDYVSGHRGLDAQHRQLFVTANALLEESSAATSRCLVLLDELIMLAMDHFQHEEAEMERAGYARLADHCREHAVLLRDTLLHRQRLVESRGDCRELVRYLVDELIQGHLLGSDRDFHALLRPPTARLATPASVGA